MTAINTGRSDKATPARLDRVVGSGPRYAPLKPEEIEEEAQGLVADIKRAFNIPPTSPMPDVSLITLRHPGMFKGQMTMGIELAGKGALPHRDRELAILRLAQLAGAPFEWSEHVDIAKRCGVTGEEIERTTEGSSAPGWSEHEAALLRAVEELVGDFCIADATWDTLAKTYGEKQMMELPMLVGAYLMTAMQQNTLRIRPKGGFDYR